MSRSNPSPHLSSQPAVFVSSSYLFFVFFFFYFPSFYFLQLDLFFNILTQPIKSKKKLNPQFLKKLNNPQILCNLNEEIVCLTLLMTNINWYFHCYYYWGLIVSNASFGCDISCHYRVWSLNYLIECQFFFYN